jgi:hypothetical protein
MRTIITTLWIVFIMVNVSFTESAIAQEALLFSTHVSRGVADDIASKCAVPETHSAGFASPGNSLIEAGAQSRSINEQTCLVDDGASNNMIIISDGDVTYTKVDIEVVSIVSSSSSSSAVASSIGCSTCITTDGTTCLAGTEIHMPPSTGTQEFVVGATGELQFNIELPAGTPHAIMNNVGDFNFSGTTDPTCQFGPAGLIANWYGIKTSN